MPKKKTLVKEDKTEHRPESAGRLMTTDVPTAETKSSLRQIREMLEKEVGHFESINYIYILDAHKKLRGVISIKDLLLSPKSKLAKDIMAKNPASVRTHTDQERVALLAIKHKIKAVPVIDKDEHFLGAITSDTILKTLHSESIEDALRFAGAGKLDNPAIDIIEASAWLYFRKRLPWLVFGFAGGTVAAFVVSSFEKALTEHVILAAFIPIVVYMADAVGVQTQTIFIRSLALSHKLDLKKYIKRELGVTVSLAIFLGTMSFCFALFWLKSSVFGLILGIAITFAILIAMVVALALPWMLQKMKFDPAIASGPFATVIRDITSLLVYFGAATLLL